MNPLVGGGPNSQALITDQLKILKKSSSKDVKAFAKQKLKLWKGRAVSPEDITETIKEAINVVGRAKENASEEDRGQLENVFTALNKTAEKIGQADRIAQERFQGQGAKTLASCLDEIDLENLNDHPAYKEGWSWKMAEAALKHKSVPVGGYLLLKDEMGRLSVYVKEKEGEIENYNLTEKETGGYKIEEEIAFGSYYGSDDEGGFVLESDDEEEEAIQPMDSGKREEEPVDEPAILKTLVTPIPELPKRFLGLLKLKANLENLRFVGFDGKRGNRVWSSLEEKSPEALKHEGLTDDYKWRHFAVPVISYSKTAIQLTRNGEPVFFHGNRVEGKGHTFVCHQLPTDHSRDDLWLSLWNDAGEGGGRATMVKLSTEGCRGTCELPILRRYWPASEEGIGDFEKECEKSLQLIEKKSEKASIERQIKRRQTRIGKLEKKLEDPEQDPAQVKEDIAKLEEEIRSRQEHLDLTYGAQKKYIEGELKDFKDKKSPGIFARELKTRDGITVKLESKEKIEGLPGAFKRTFTLTKDGEEGSRTVTQIDYPEWKDYSATKAEALIKLRKICLDIHKGNPSPLYVHCRAGVGRTGTLVAFIMSMSEIEQAFDEGRLDEIDPKEVVCSVINDIREQRNFQMVQQPIQAQLIVSALTQEVSNLPEEQP